MHNASFWQVKVVLVPIDFSPVSRSVVARAVALAGPKGASLVLMHVVQPPAVLADYDPALPVIQTMTRAAARQLNRWKEYVEGHGVAATTVCLKATSPSKAIAAEAEQRSVDYIVIGSHGHGAFYDLLVGSTTGGVLRKAGCPVVIVPAAQPVRSRARVRQDSIQTSGPLGEPTNAMPRQLREHTAGIKPRSLPHAQEKPDQPIPNYAN
jgi:nucleotide-binding universal stress UspA family protein